MLIHCLQSGGCSLFAYLLAQRARTVVVIDLFVDFPIPTEADFYRCDAGAPRGGDAVGGGGGGGDDDGAGAVDLIVVKAVIHGPEISAPVDGRLAELRARFKPDVALLFVRAREPVRAVDASGGRS